MIGMRRGLVLLAVACVGLAGSCLKLKDRTVLLPDGSGKMTVSVAIATSAKKMLLGPAPETPESVLERAATITTGHVAITDPAVERTEEWETTTFTVWFEDVNELKVERGSSEYRLRWTKDGDGFTLDVRPPWIAHLAKQLASDEKLLAGMAPEQRKMAQEFIAEKHAHWKGFEGRTEIRLPGPVRSVEGLSKTDDRTVVAAVGGVDLADTEKVKALTTSVFRAKCGPSSMTPAEIASFRDDLAKAKAAWSKSPFGAVVQAKALRRVECAEDFAKWTITRNATRFISETLMGDQATIRDGAGRELAKFPLSGGYVAELDISGDFARLYVLFDTPGRLVSSDIATRSLSALEIPSGRIAWERMAPDVRGRNKPEWQFTPLADGTIVLVSNRKEIEILNGATGAVVRTLPGTWNAGAPTALRSPSRFLVSEDNRTLSAVDALTGARLWSATATFGGQPSISQSVATGSDAGPILWNTGEPSGSRELTALDPDSGRELWRLPVGRMREPIVSRSGRVAVMRGPDAAWLFDAARGRRVGRIEFSEAVTTRLAFGDDDSTLWAMPEYKAGPALRAFRLDLPAELAPQAVRPK